MTWTTVSASRTISDSFTQDDGALGADWTEQTNAPTVANNAVIAGSVAGLSLAYRSGESYGLDHSSSIEITDATATSVIVGVNMSGSAARGYLLNANPASGTWSLNAYVSGALSIVWSASGSTTWEDGDVLKVALSGTTVYAYRNCVSLTSKTAAGAGLTRGGAPGFGFIKASGTQTADNWIGTGALQEWGTSSAGTAHRWQQVSPVADADGGVDFTLRLQTEFPAFNIQTDRAAVLVSSFTESP